MAVKAISLNRRIQIKRFAQTGTDGFGSPTGEWADLGQPVSANRQDVSDEERFVAARLENKLVARFIIRSSGFARGLKRSDMIAHEGAPFHITGIRQLPANAAFLEITAVTSEALIRQPPFEV